MSVPRWFVFACNVNRGYDDNGRPQTEWDGRYLFAYDWQEAYGHARTYVTNLGYDFAAVLQYVEGKGLELDCTFGYRPARNEYDLPGSRADGWLLVKKWCEAVLSKVESTSTKE